MAINILDNTYEPSFDEITNYIEGSANKRWQETVTFIESSFKTKSQMFYSKCSTKKGWNVKYKNHGKALCTLYPEKDYFTALVVLNQDNMEWFKGMRQGFTPYLLNLFDNCRLFNGTKWLMIDVTNDKILNDVKQLIMLKNN